ncbi:bifunctional hydroxymethylpyrimidine kinase/phosphomethylpyrimidine kinase [Fluviispira sanaruensis]|uniref:hydroxymethylpyrimidine kinase n=1 Tax=Fluviispira sanaruensis TaxID=2493639 RepID=A0A4P2VLX6_FLUSA|nr:bifunctional hydroxymethylpyrimidine kinase/phosphomethylpyrimidine kinase [Fluviispira sanaruensis]BBH54356.1 bifunctional hydroxymethylpyrimidine kinase/phosphomethylpyrimidine kinase [Fluviispira sanaruensis]
MRNLGEVKIYSRVLSIAGSDSGGGAGIQADLKTFHEFKCYGASVITAITSQNTMGVFNIQEISQNSIATQLECVLSDIGFDSIKIGMLFTDDIIKIVSEKLVKYKCKNIVLDPVILSKNNFKLLKDDALNSLLNDLLPLAEILTPNLPEAEILLSRKISSLKDMENAAIDLLLLGPRAVILKGGHFENGNKSSDCMAISEGNKVNIIWLESEKIITNNSHGTGCTFSAAIAANLAKGMDRETSFQIAKNYISKSIMRGSCYKIGNGIGPVCHFS